jgi:hypothetical protein
MAGHLASALSIFAFASAVVMSPTTVMIARDGW